MVHVQLYPSIRFLHLEENSFRPTIIMSGAEQTLYALRARAADRMGAATRAAARCELAVSLEKVTAEKSEALRGIASADVVADAITEESSARLGAQAARRGFRGATCAAQAAAARAHATEARVHHRHSVTQEVAQRKQEIRGRQAAWRSEAVIRQGQERLWTTTCVAKATEADTWRQTMAHRQTAEKQAKLAEAHRQAAAAARKAEVIKRRSARMAAQLATRHDDNNDGVLDEQEFARLESQVAGDGRIDQGDFLRMIASK